MVWAPVVVGAWALLRECLGEAEGEGEVSQWVWSGAPGLAWVGFWVHLLEKNTF